MLEASPFRPYFYVTSLAERKAMELRFFNENFKYGSDLRYSVMQVWTTCCLVDGWQRFGELTASIFRVMMTGEFYTIRARGLVFITDKFAYSSAAKRTWPLWGSPT